MKKNMSSEEEMQLWYTWKYSYKTIFDNVIREVSEQTGLSEGDFGILDRLDLHGDGQLRQQDLAKSMNWDKSRLSHHLTRMEKRNLLIRDPLKNERGVQIIITKTGKIALQDARPVVSMAIRKHFIHLLDEEDIRSITNLADKSKQSLESE